MAEDTIQTAIVKFQAMIDALPEVSSIGNYWRQLAEPKPPSKWMKFHSLLAQAAFGNPPRYAPSWLFLPRREP